MSFKINSKLLTITRHMATLKTVYLDRGNNTNCTVQTFGATVTSWRVNNIEQLFVSKQAIFNEKQPIRGGVPLVFPYFGCWKLGPQHGFARILPWKIEYLPRTIENGDVEVMFSLQDTAFTRSMWNHCFQILYKLTLHEKQLCFNVVVNNTDKSNELNFNLLLHNYLRVRDVRKCEISGLTGCQYIDKTKTNQSAVEELDKITISDLTDRVYTNSAPVQFVTDTTTNRKIRIEKCNFPDTVIWNPWSTQAKNLTDFGDNEYELMVCIEPGYIQQPVRLLPGTKFNAAQILELYSIQPKHCI